MESCSYFIHLPMKMEPIVSSETSATKSQTPGNYPKRNKLRVNGTLSESWAMIRLADDIKFGGSVGKLI